MNCPLAISVRVHLYEHQCNHKLFFVSVHRDSDWQEQQVFFFSYYQQISSLLEGEVGLSLDGAWPSYTNKQSVEKEGRHRGRWGRGQFGTRGRQIL